MSPSIILPLPSLTEKSRPRRTWSSRLGLRYAVCGFLGLLLYLVLSEKLPSHPIRFTDNIPYETHDESKLPPLLPTPTSSALENDDLAVAPPNPWPERAEAVKAAFKHAYTSYKRVAFPHDEIRPLSEGYVDKYVLWLVHLRSEAH
jgi:hypothetical protein